MDEVRNPHDALFRRTFSRLEEARALLEAELPRSVRRRIDWSTLRLLPGSFVDEALRERHTDLLFSAQLGGREALLYVLLEHQSRPDPWMPLRLVRYQVRIWERWLHDHPGARRLPPILPVVLHHGAGRWRAPTSLGALYDLPAVDPELSPHLLEQQILLDDLAGATDEAIAKRSLTVFGELTVKALVRLRHLPKEAVMPEIWRWQALARRVARAPYGLQKLIALLNYVSQVTEITQADLEDFARVIDPPEENDAMVTLAEKWMAQGREQGLEKGLEKGLEQGLEASRGVLLRILRARFPEAPHEALAPVHEADFAALERWSERLFTATRVEDVFAD